MHVQGADYLIDRETFKWHTNPLIHLTREAIAATITEAESTGDRSIVNELDVTMQSMLSLCHYQPSEVWEGDVEAITEAAARTETDFKGEAGERFSTKVADGFIWPNLDLIVPVVRTQYSRQVTERERLDPTLVQFVRGELGKFDHPEPVTTTKGREFYKEVDDSTGMVVKEKHTGKRIIMRRTDLETSQLYAKELHYVHKAREDEIVAYGAYIEGQELPFAWVSYSPIGSASEQQIAQHAGREAERTLEMTRAWNTAWSPKNTMSVLFSYAHSQLQAASKSQSVKGVPVGLGGVITAINPNLGFSGMAFSGVDFGVVGLKPTNHKFLIENGVPIYMLRRDIARHLGTTVAELAQHEQYSESAMPLSHTNVMMVLFDKSARKKPTPPIYVVGGKTTSK